MSDRQIESDSAGISPITFWQYCSHVEEALDSDLYHFAGIELTNSCQDCPNRGENWVCLSCQTVMCSRYVNSHALTHFSQTGHKLVLSFSDLIVWCYACDKYIEHESLDLIVQHFRALKFGISSPQATSLKSSFLETKSIEALANCMKFQVFKKIAVLVGSGISVSAGIPYFRDPVLGMRRALVEHEGLVTPETQFEIKYFRSNPEVFFKVIGIMFGDFAPTSTHYFLKLLAEKNCLLQCFTQNIDGLEFKAGVTPDLVTQAHGNLDAAHCSRCGIRFDLALIKQHASEGTVARCECGGPAKPDIVFFGEPMIPGYFDRLALLDEADLLLIIGTSLKVFPTASIVSQVKDNVPRVSINYEASGRNVGLDYENPNSRDVLLQGTSDDIIETLVRMAGWEDDFKAVVIGK